MTTASNTKRHKRLSILCVAAVLCFSQAALAQSGRRKKNAPPTPTPSPTTTEQKTAAATDPKPTEAETIKPPIRITSLIVNGQTIIPGGYYWSQDVDITVKECMSRLKEHPVLTVTRGGMRNRGEAIRRAKLEKNAYVLWMEINLKDNVWTAPSITHIDYFLFMPKTAKIVTQGQVDPNNIVHIVESGTRVPRTVDKPPSTSIGKLRAAAWEIADRVRGWF